MSRAEQRKQGALQMNDAIGKQTEAIWTRFAVDPLATPFAALAGQAPPRHPEAGSPPSPGHAPWAPGWRSPAACSASVEHCSSSGSSSIASTARWPGPRARRARLGGILDLVADIGGHRDLHRRHLGWRLARRTARSSRPLPLSPAGRRCVLQLDAWRRGSSWPQQPRVERRRRLGRPLDDDRPRAEVLGAPEPPTRHEPSPVGNRGRDPLPRAAASPGSGSTVDRHRAVAGPRLLRRRRRW